MLRYGPVSTSHFYSVNYIKSDIMGGKNPSKNSVVRFLSFSKKIYIFKQNINEKDIDIM